MVSLTHECLVSFFPCNDTSLTFRSLFVEPTSGLDSYQATQVIETLRKLADKGKTIVSVIHQPSQHTFQLFDDLLLISEGKLMYFGEVSKVRDYMTDLGYGCETEVGTAEHVLDCVSRVVGADDEAEKLEFFMVKVEDPAIARNYGIFALPAVVHYENGIPNIYEGVSSHKAILNWLLIYN